CVRWGGYYTLLDYW
nr:immunoglobulin heavy chain junction region [Macaca mulatta]